MYIMLNQVHRSFSSLPPQITIPHSLIQFNIKQRLRLWVLLSASDLYVALSWGQNLDCPRDRRQILSSR